MLALLSHNISQVRYTAGIRPLIISVVAAVLLFLLFRLIYRDWHRAAFATAAFIVLFYTYGQVFDLIQKKWKTPPARLVGCTLARPRLSWCWSGQAGAGPASRAPR